MSESGVIRDGVLGANKAEVNSNNALKVIVDSVTGSAADASQIAIFDPDTGATANVDANGSLLSAAIDSVGLYVENKAEVLLIGVTATTTQQIDSSVQTNLHTKAAMFYVIVSTTVTTTIRLTLQTTCDFLARMLTFASVSLDGLTSGNTPFIFVHSQASTGLNPIGGVLPRTLLVHASITSSTTNTFTPSITVGMKRVL